MTRNSPGDCLDAQTETLAAAGFPRLCGMTDQGFRSRIAALRSRLDDPVDEPMTGNIPLCIGFRRGLASVAAIMAGVKAKGATGVVDMTPLSPADFEIIDGVRLPEDDLYLLLDVDTGRDFLNVSPEDSLAAIRARGRTPLTLEEGVALTAQRPALLTDKTRYNCIQTPGSRRKGDQRVPSIWFSKGAPRLGWCWDRNIHTWLGSASAARRLGASPPA